MPNIDITVRKCIAKTNWCEPIVADNSDYTLTWDFDAEWRDSDGRVARLEFSGGHADIPFIGDTLTLPPLPSDANIVKVGAFQNDIRTTSPAIVMVIPSILASGGSEYTFPVPDFEALELLAQASMITPLVDGDDNIYTDDNGNILCF